MIDIIHSYTRAQAIADGVLVDVSATASEAGIAFPTVLTAAVWAMCVEEPTNCNGQDATGRLWDVVQMLRYAIGQAANTDRLTFTVLVRNDDRGPRKVQLKAVCGPGDNGEPVITVMLPNED